MKKVDIDGISIKIKLTDQYFYRIIQKIEEGRVDKFIEDSEVDDWVQKCLVG